LDIVPKQQRMEHADELFFGGYAVSSMLDFRRGSHEAEGTLLMLPSRG
jgi:hypothetical protein